MYKELTRRYKESLGPGACFWKGLPERIRCRNRKPAKVFVIGFHKTGTTSVGKALQVLGYQVCTYFQNPDFQRRENVTYNSLWAYAQRLIPHFNAFEDTPWFMFYREIDRLVPEAKFILMVREEASWLDSVLSHFGGRFHAMHEWIYGHGDPVGNETAYLDAYRRHNREVQAYFRDRPDKLLVIDWAEFEGWTELCAFLGESRPRRYAFPRSNPRDIRQKRWHHFKRKLRDLWKSA